MATLQGNGSVALDDFSLTPECVVIPGTPSPPPLSTTESPCHNEFPCNTGSEVPECIPYDQVCDFVQNCLNGHDERLCGTTSFETDMGGWQDASTTAYSWSRINASDAQYPNCTAPGSDHTSGSPEGYYMWAPAKLSDSPESTAILASPVLGPLGLGCTFKFWYFCKNDNPILTVMAWTAGEVKEQLAAASFGCFSNQEWRQGHLFIGEQQLLITVEIKSTKYFLDWSKTRLDVAIDDTTFNLCSTIEEPIDEDIKCTFSEPCHFYQSHRDSADFTLITEKHGHHVALLGDNSERTAVLETLPRVPSIGFCLSFRYLVQGLKVPTLKIVLSQSSLNETVFEQQRGFQDWQTFHLNLYAAEVYKVQFVGSTWADNSAVRLDDLELVDGPCPPSLTCNFDEETKYCHWENYLSVADLPWISGYGAEAHYDSGPQVDHSWGSPYGHYMYLTLEDQQRKTALLKSPELTTTTPEGDCFQFWFYLYSEVKAEKVGELGVRVLSNGTLSDRLWEHTYNGQDGWQFGETTVKHDKNFSVVLEGLTLDGSEGSMAWDDLGVRRGVCTDPGTCDFEGGLCGWTEVNVTDSGSNTWLWLVGEQSSNGLAVDHTMQTGLGHYVAFERAYCTHEAACVAALRSNDITPKDTNYCFTFYMNAFKSEVNKNEMVVKQINVENHSLVHIWKYFHQYDYTWIPYHIQLTKLKYLFHLELEATILPMNASVGAFSALDDVSLTPGLCDAGGSTVLPPTGTPPPDTQLTCTFEDLTLCGWGQDLDDARNWVLTSGETVPSDYGPNVDHTTQLSEGHFIYLDTSRPPGDANLFSETLADNEAGHCFSFAYYMHGSAPPFLKFYIVKESENPGSSAIPNWQHVDEVGEIWQQVHLFIPNQAFAQRVVVRGEVQASDANLGHTAIDDFLLTDGSCQNLEEIWCDFETSDLCEWTTMYEGEGKWIWNSGQNPEWANSPPIDHTFGSPYGHYCSFKPSPDNVEDETYLLSNVYHGSGQVCLQFYYYMQGPSEDWSGQLYMYWKSPSQDIEGILPSLKMLGPQGDGWNLGMESNTLYGNFEVSYRSALTFLPPLPPLGVSPCLHASPFHFINQDVSK